MLSEQARSSLEGIAATLEGIASDGRDRGLTVDELLTTLVSMHEVIKIARAYMNDEAARTEPVMDRLRITIDRLEVLAEGAPPWN